ncbi:MAG: hypothetical protein HQL31_06520 [Planctomycetes bacterium]|nr:hypothetical protein [Planctomycetota bacterium]
MGNIFRHRQRNAFTLMEMLVVICIIFILVGIGINGIRSIGDRFSARTDVKMIEAMMETCQREAVAQNQVRIMEVYTQHINDTIPPISAGNEWSFVSAPTCSSVAFWSFDRIYRNDAFEGINGMHLEHVNPPSPGKVVQDIGRNRFAGKLEGDDGVGAYDYLHMFVQKDTPTDYSLKVDPSIIPPQNGGLSISLYFKPNLNKMDSDYNLVNMSLDGLFSDTAKCLFSLFLRTKSDNADIIQPCFWIRQGDTAPTTIQLESAVNCNNREWNSLQLLFFENHYFMYLNGTLAASKTYSARWFSTDYWVVSGATLGGATGTKPQLEVGGVCPDFKTTDTIIPEPYIGSVDELRIAAIIGTDRYYAGGVRISARKGKNLGAVSRIVSYLPEKSAHQSRGHHFIMFMPTGMVKTLSDINSTVAQKDELNLMVVDDTYTLKTLANVMIEARKPGSNQVCSPTGYAYSKGLIYDQANDCTLDGTPVSGNIQDQAYAVYVLRVGRRGATALSKAK